MKSLIFSFNLNQRTDGQVTKDRQMGRSKDKKNHDLSSVNTLPTPTVNFRLVEIRFAKNKIFTFFS
jgi:hypothetical protein